MNPIIISRINNIIYLIEAIKTYLQVNFTQNPGVRVIHECGLYRSAGYT
jgi:hypothetical protein